VPPVTSLRSELITVDQLRDVELIVQERLAKPDTEVSKDERDTLLKIQAVLYSTEVRKARHMNWQSS
jgi:hypothetical protein